MASIHPAIEKMAHGHHLGAPLRLVTHTGALVALWCLVVVYGLGSILFGVGCLGLLLSGQDDAGGLFLLCLVCLGGAFFLYWGMKETRATPYYCLCTEGFLELKPGDPPKMVHAVRWDAINSVYKSGYRPVHYSVRTRQGKEIRLWLGHTRQTIYWVSIGHGKEIRIWDSGIWEYCNAHVYARTGKYA